LAEKIRPTQSGLQGPGGLFAPPTRPTDAGREIVAPTGAPKRWRERMPTRAQLEALLHNGRLILPMRYIRGYFLDLFV
jgi:hypothetical protein